MQVYGSAFIVQFKLQHLYLTLKCNIIVINSVRLAAPFFLFWGALLHPLLALHDFTQSYEESAGGDRLMQG